MVRRKRTWSDSDLKDAVKNSYSFAQVMDKLNLIKGGSNKTIKFHIKNLNIDTSHFKSVSELRQEARKNIKTKSKEELFIENGKYHDYQRVKIIILREKLLDYKCAECGLFEWKNKALNLQMDHINGNKCDNRLENLRLLCPNCHSQTNNFCGKNIKHNKIINKCIECGTDIHRQSIWCRACKKIESSKQTKIVWPSVTELQDMVQKFGYLESGRRLGVSDNAIRKRIKKYGSVV